ncbi:hypothetical protein P5V15_006714 [Pogonomyrmex californicus]
MSKVHMKLSRRERRRLEARRRRRRSEGKANEGLDCAENRRTIHSAVICRPIKKVRSVNSQFDKCTFDTNKTGKREREEMDNKRNTFRIYAYIYGDVHRRKLVSL